MEYDICEHDPNFERVEKRCKVWKDIAFRMIVVLFRNPSLSSPHGSKMLFAAGVPDTVLEALYHPPGGRQTFFLGANSFFWR